jgi:hypothetical protein
MPQFSPYEGGLSMNYSQLPEEILEEQETLRTWTGRALDVARAAKRSRATGKGRTKRAGNQSTAKKAVTKKRAKKAAAKKSAKKTVAKRRRP